MTQKFWMSGPNFRCKIASLSATHHGASWWVECRTAEVLFAVALSPCHESSMSVYFGHLSCVNESTPNFQLSFWYDFLCRPLTTERIWSKVLPKRAELPAAHAERPFGLSTSARLQIDWCRSAPGRLLWEASNRSPVKALQLVELRAKAQCVCVSNVK